jgi:hypothetical protein
LYHGDLQILNGVKIPKELMTDRIEEFMGNGVFRYDDGVELRIEGDQ